jgi:hypothetical protein
MQKGRKGGSRGVVVEDVTDLEVQRPVRPDERVARGALHQHRLRHRGGGNPKPASSSCFPLRSVAFLGVWAAAFSGR